MTPIQREHIDLIRKISGGALYPEVVLADAKNPNSPLHPMFTWDDSEAANAFRLIQAKAVIRVAVRFSQPLHVEPTRARVTMGAAPASPEAPPHDPKADARRDYIELSKRDAEIGVVIDALEKEKAWLYPKFAKCRDEGGIDDDAGFEANIIDQFIRGVPMDFIIEVFVDNVEGGDKDDVLALISEFNVRRPKGWTEALADQEWANQDCDIEGVIGVPAYEPPKRFAGNDRDQGGSLRRFKNYAHKDNPPTREGASLRDDHPALEENRTQFPSSVVDADQGDHIFVSGHSNAKIGAFVTKGPWKGMDIFTLTLEERATCPPSCDLLKSCYGNALPLAKRRRYSPELVKRMDGELRQMAREHPAGFVIRLHVLGDFPDLGYVQQWSNWMADIPQINVFGYTAHPVDTAIGQFITQMNNELMGRWAIRFSVAPDVEIDAMQATTIWREGRGRVPEGLVCPASSGDTEACGTCGLCWSPMASGWRIVFLGHGRNRKGLARAAETISHDADLLSANAQAEASAPPESESRIHIVAPPIDQEDTALEGAAPFDPFARAGSSDSRTGPTATYPDAASTATLDRLPRSTRTKTQSPPRSFQPQDVRR